jgi:hypothetical protein
MIVEAAALGKEKDASTLATEKNTSGPIMVDGENALEESLPTVRQFTLEGQKEVTIRQVAPLVLVLTGATFLNVSVLCTTCDRTLLIAIDNFGSISCHYTPIHQP